LHLHQRHRPQPARHHPQHGPGELTLKIDPVDCDLHFSLSGKPFFSRYTGIFQNGLDQANIHIPALMRIWQYDNRLSNDHVRVLAARVWSLQAQIFELFYEDAVRDRS